MGAWLSHGDRLGFSALRARAERIGAAPRHLAIERVQRLDAHAVGWLQVGTAPVWLTLEGRADDWVLMPGERMPMKRGERALVEPWRAGTVAELRWQAAPGWRQRAFGALGARARGTFAAGLRGLAVAFAAWARSAEAMARRAQGCMAGGESTASSGAVQ
jgi:Protein of unknown function (DUF2917)